MEVISCCISPVSGLRRAKLTKIRFVLVGETDTYDSAVLSAVPREGESIYFGDDKGVFKVARVLWEPYYSDGFSPERGRVTVLIYKDS